MNGFWTGFLKIAMAQDCLEATNGQKAVAVVGEGAVAGGTEDAKSGVGENTVTLFLKEIDGRAYPSLDSGRLLPPYLQLYDYYCLP